MLWFEILIWVLLGMVVSLSVSFFNLWRGSPTQVTVLAALGAIVGGFAFKAIPGTSIDGFDVLALIGALMGAVVVMVVAARRTGRGAPLV
jgi:hypothetical protein